MKLRWLPAAAEDLREIYDYLYVDSYEVAHRIVNEIYSSIRSLQSTPYIGRLDPAQNTRVLILPRIRYKVTYRIHLTTLEILRIRHTSRDPRIH
jgi:toxin ParE1/3/4